MFRVSVHSAAGLVRKTDSWDGESSLCSFLEAVACPTRFAGESSLGLSVPASPGRDSARHFSTSVFSFFAQETREEADAASAGRPEWGEEEETSPSPARGGGDGDAEGGECSRELASVVLLLLLSSDRRGEREGGDWGPLLTEDASSELLLVLSFSAV